MFHSVLKCVLYARSRRSISFWYFSIENGGGAKRSTPCSSAKRAYIACIMSWISAACVGGARRSRARIDAKKSLIASRTPLVNGLRLDVARACAPALRAQRLEPDAVEQAVRLLGEHVAQRGVALQPALEQLPSPRARASIMCSTTSWFLPRSVAQLGELLGDARRAAPRAIARTPAASAAHLGLDRARRRCRAWPGSACCDSASSSAGRRLLASSASSPLTFASSAFCADTGNTCVARARRASRRGLVDLPVDLGVDRRPRVLSSSHRPSILLRMTRRPARGAGVVAGEVLRSRPRGRSWSRRCRPRG